MQTVPSLRRVVKKKQKFYSYACTVEWGIPVLPGLSGGVWDTLRDTT